MKKEIMSKIESQESASENPQSENWFASWFDTDYYHILYKDRNDDEAQQFMDNLTHYLNLPEEAKILDLACGKGRHSIYLNSLGFDVTGADLSENSIAEASKFSNKNLRFKEHDMRISFEEKYDAIFNLFTSFGYFENDADNLKTQKMSIAQVISILGLSNIKVAKKHISKLGTHCHWQPLVGRRGAGGLDHR